MTRREFFLIWKRCADKYDLSSAEALVDCVGSNQLKPDALDDPALLTRIDDALGRWLVANDDLGDIFMELEDEEVSNAGPI